MSRSGPPLSPSRRQVPGDGPLEVFVTDEQGEHPVDVARWSQLAEQVLAALGVWGAAELAILFVSEAAIADLNERFMGEPGPTDVLAFPIDDDVARAGRFSDTDRAPAPSANDRGGAPVILGDVVICPAVAARNAPDHAGTYDDEIALLVVHGILHVLGMDHADADEAAAMQATERDLLARFHVPGAPPDGPPAR